MQVAASFEHLRKPQTIGSEFLTYVLWAISPEGRQVNIGEVLVGDNHRSKLDVTTDLQAFALIVTAEPYYAVRRPSNLVVLENAIRSDTVGGTEDVNAKYELIDRGGYTPTGYKFDPLILNDKLPLEFFEAQKAVMERGEWRGELTQITKDGKELIVQSRWTLVRDELGNPVQKLIVNTDVTETSRLEDELQRAAQLSFVGELAAGLARAGVSVISGGAMGPRLPMTTSMSLGLGAGRMASTSRSKSGLSSTSLIWASSRPISR